MLAGACSIEHGNEVLPSFIERYNERFAKPPADALTAHRSVAHCWGPEMMLMRPTDNANAGPLVSA
jgi:hypothetical protein